MKGSESFSPRVRGITMVMLSATVYGFTPVLAAMTYSYGNNGIQMAFLRALLPIPILLILCRNYPKPGKKQLFLGICTGLLSFGCTMLLYSSYVYLSVGVATTLHFLYPLYVSLYEAVFRKKPLGWQRVLGLLLALAGMACFMEKDARLNPVGALLAVSSGVLYAGYIILLEEEAKDPMPINRLMLIHSCTGIGVCGIAGLLTGSFYLPMGGKAWMYIVISVMMVVFLSCMFFQRGLRLIGGNNAAVFSLLEPIMSILFSILMMGDHFTLLRAAGCALIIGGLLLTALVRSKKAPAKNLEPQ